MRIAFFWVGEDIAIPQIFADSVRRVHGESVDLIQLSDLETPEVCGVTRVQRLRLSPMMMVARLQSYASLELTSEFTFFCDADSILISPLMLPNYDGNLLLTPRVHDGPINARFPEFYPEFVGKTLGSVMPYMFGAIAARLGTSVFTSSLGICESLPERFQRWYGDQVSLKIFVDQKKPNYSFLDPYRHLFIMRERFDTSILLNLVEKKVQLMTFKGPLAKDALRDWGLKLKHFGSIGY